MIIFECHLLIIPAYALHFLLQNNSAAKYPVYFLPMCQHCFLLHVPSTMKLILGSTPFVRKKPLWQITVSQLFKRA